MKVSNRRNSVNTDKFWFRSAVGVNNNISAVNVNNNNLAKQVSVDYVINGKVKIHWVNATV